MVKERPTGETNANREKYGKKERGNGRKRKTEREKTEKEIEKVREHRRESD